MLIVLGGVLGSGRKALGRALAAKYGFYHYDLADKKFREYHRNVHGEVEERVRQPHDDAARMHLYARAFAELRPLSKMYNTVLLEDSFHRKGPRDWLLAETKKIFSPVVFIWIESQESDARLIIERMVKRKALKNTEAGMAGRRHVQKELELPEPDVPRFQYAGTSEEELEKLLALAQKRG